jgi:hypothetical protein
MEPSTAPAAENKIDKLSASVGVTTDGAEWMKEALDPFPDEPRRCSGFPDQVSGPSVVQKLKYFLTVASPTPTTAALWDAHIYFDSFDNNAALWNTIAEGMPDITLGVAGQTNANLSAGGLVVRTGPTNTPLLLATIDGNLPIPQSYFTNGKTRVIAKAFEVSNTTPPLYKGGAVTVYRSPAKATVRAGCFQKNLATAGNVNNVTTLLIDYLVPETISEVMNFEDTEVFEAEKGAYCVATLSEPIIEPLDFREAVTPVMYDAGANNAMTTQIVANPSGNTFAANQVFPGKFNLSGAYLTGLSQQTSLTVTVHYVIERFVNQDNLDLVVMTTKSPSFDPAAFELYSRAAAALPPGVPVGSNADGDWIKNVCDVLSTFGVPGMPLVKGAVDLWNGVKMTPNQNQINSEEKRLQQMEKRILSMTNKPAPRQNQPRKQIQQPRQPKKAKQQRQPQKKKAQSANSTDLSSKEMSGILRSLLEQQEGRINNKI